MNKLIDAHHHIWPQADLPWLNGPMQPRIFGPYESIMRDYLIDEYQEDIASSSVEQSVYVQANWAVEKAVDEVAWVQHAGMLEDSSANGRKLWRNNMQALAEQPNVMSKLSAFGTFIHRNDPDRIKDMITQTVQIFGSERCLFGSNFPIEKIWTDYASLVGAFIDASQELTDTVRQHIFYDTAKRVYRL